jgi:hypothetical protein
MFRVFACAAVLAAPVSAFAATIDSTSNQEVTTDGSASGDRGRSLVGAAGGDGSVQLNVVNSFLLPDLGPGGAFATASFSLPAGDFTFGTDAGVVVDLYAIPAGTTANPSGPDFFYVGPDDTTNATLLVAGLIEPDDSGNDAVIIDTGENVGLLNYLNDAYVSNGPGAYVYLRLSPRSLLSEDGGYDIYRDNTGDRLSEFGGSETPAGPQITYTVVPEPTSLLAGCASIGLLARRRR